MVCLDDFYRDSDDPIAPRNGNSVDWESPLAWDQPAALEAIETLCHIGEARMPIYAFDADRRVGWHTTQLAGSPLFIAEGIFAAEIVAACAQRSLLAGAFALRRPRGLTYLRRIARDLAERRKPPGVIVRRGLALLRAEPAILARQAELGAVPARAHTILTTVAAARQAAASDRVAGERVAGERVADETVTTPATRRTPV